jgi:hypothetical protein
MPRDRLLLRKTTGERLPTERRGVRRNLREKTWNKTGTEVAEMEKGSVERRRSEKELALARAMARK